MEKEFVPYEQALALKKLRFADYCLGLYSYGSKNTMDMQHVIHTCKASSKLVWMRAPTPTFSQVFRWFREKYELYFNIHRLQHAISTKKEFMLTIDAPLYGGYCESYEEAELACLKKLIEIAKSL